MHLYRISATWNDGSFCGYVDVPGLNALDAIERAWKTSEWKTSKHPPRGFDGRVSAENLLTGMAIITEVHSR